MTLDDFQTAATRTLNSSLTPEDQLLDAAAGLAEEAGEVLAIIRKHRMQRRPLDHAHLREELGDALWCLATVAHRAGLTLNDVAESNVAKLKARWPDGMSGPGT